MKQVAGRAIRLSKVQAYAGENRKTTRQFTLVICTTGTLADYQQTIWCLIQKKELHFFTTASVSV
jgi:hypothetical protein